MGGGGGKGRHGHGGKRNFFFLSCSSRSFYLTMIFPIISTEIAQRGGGGQMQPFPTAAIKS